MIKWSTTASAVLACVLALLASVHASILAIVFATYWYSVEKGMCPRSTWKLALAYLAIPIFIALVCMTRSLVSRDYLSAVAIRWFFRWAMVAGAGSVAFILAPLIPSLIPVCV